MSRFGQYKKHTKKKGLQRIEPFLRNKEVFLDLGEQNLVVKRQLSQLGCNVLTLPNNLTPVTSVFISVHPVQYYTRKRPPMAPLSIDKIMKQSRSGRAIKMMHNMKQSAYIEMHNMTKSTSIRSTSKSSFLKAQALNPKIRFHYYPEIKARLDREVKLNHPHEYRFDFDMSSIKFRYPHACQYFITDAKGI